MSANLIGPASALLGGLSRRERLLIAALGLIALVLVPVGAADYAHRALSDVVNAQAELAQARTGAMSPNLTVAKRALETERARLRSWAWPAPSLSTGRVMLEQTLGESAREAGLLDAEVKSGDLTETIGDLSMVRIELTAAFRWPELCRFVHRISGRDRLVIVDSISVQGAPARLQMNLHVPILVAAERSR